MRTSILSNVNRSTRSAWARISRHLCRERSGNVGIIFGLAAPVLFAAVGGAVDYSMYLRDKTRLQNLTDAAALASAHEMQMAKADSTRIAAVAESYVHNQRRDVLVNSQVDMKALSVTVDTQTRFNPYMGRLFWQSAPDVKATATAKLNGNLPLCLLALDGSTAGAVHLEASARMTAPGCMVYSDSKSPSGIQAKDNATAKAALICSAGGTAKTASAKFTPEPVPDCPVISDPLASRTRPADTACSFNGKAISGGTETLHPGVYCAGLKITNGANVSLAPGIYIIKDGPLIVDKGGIIQGTDVAFYLKGPGSSLTFETASTISLSAPKTGPLAGILIFDDPTGASALAIPPYPLPLPLLGLLLQVKGPPREHKILSDDARTLLGTIYMPQGRLIIDATKPIADKSAYTVLVVRQVDLHAGPNLFLNSDYSATEVPVPDGVGPYRNKIMLTN